MTTQTHSTQIRPARADDLAACGQVMYDAFRGIATKHNFPPDFPNAEAAGGLLAMLFEAPGMSAAVAEEAGRIVGSIFVSRRSVVGGISALTVEPGAQDRSIGRQLMRHGMALLAAQGHTRQQLVQSGYHNRSLALYAKLGFVATELLSNVAGGPVRAKIPGRAVRPAREADAAACNALCREVHGFDRAGELANAIAQGMARVVESDGTITGYTTGIGFIGHGAGRGNDDIKALIASAEEFVGPGILIPTGNGELFRWCLESGLRVMQPMTLMDTAPSGPANGAYWPAVLC